MNVARCGLALNSPSRYRRASGCSARAEDGAASTRMRRPTNARVALTRRHLPDAPPKLQDRQHLSVLVLVLVLVPVLAATSALKHRRWQPHDPWLLDLEQPASQR